MLKKPFALCLVVLIAVIWLPAQAFAASAASLTPSAKTAFDKVTAAAPAAVQTKLKDQYTQLLAIAAQDAKLDAEIKSLHNANQEDLLKVNTKLKKLDEDKLAALTKQVADAKAHYQPLFDKYTDLNQQITLARKLKNKLLISTLTTQQDVMKIAVTAARDEIRKKEAALKSAKDAKAKNVKQVKETLAGMDAVNIKIKAEKSASTSTGKLITDGEKSLNQAIKLKDASGTLAYIGSLNSLSRQLVEQKKKSAASKRTSAAF